MQKLNLIFDTMDKLKKKAYMDMWRKELRTEESKQHEKDYKHQWYLANKERLLENSREYTSKNKEKCDGYKKKCYLKNKDRYLQKAKEIYQTKEGRASALLKAYNKADRDKGRGEGNLTVQWIIDNIFTKKCAHCEKIGWDVIGCNRLDNSKPHTKDNVEPCCEDCNKELGLEYMHKLTSKTVYQYTLDGELVKVWNSIHECGRNGFDCSGVSRCCRGLQETYKGFKWSYTPL